jgi:hypothetical protein
MFTDYFLEGLTALYPHNIEFSIQATDLDGDGVPLELEDLVWLYRCIVGLAVPCGLPIDPSPNVARVVHRVRGRVNEIRLLTPDTLSAMFLLIDEDITPSLVQDSVHLGYRFDGTHTRILIEDFRAPHSILEGGLLRWTGSGQVVEVQAATYDARPVTTELVTPVHSGEVPSQSLPDRCLLHQNYPNPFNASTQIAFDLPRGSCLRLDICDITGRRVALLHDGFLAAGEHTLWWDGTDDAGREVASGVYFYRLRTDSETVTRKMILLK